MAFSFKYLIEIFPYLIVYIPITLGMTLAAMVLAIVIGLIITWLSKSEFGVFRYLAALYSSLFRGIPTLVQLFLVYYGLPEIFPSLRGFPAIAACIIGLGFKQAANLSEIFRAGLDSIDEGQKEAGIALNISKAKIFFHIILPQAALNALPATGNTFISLLKETSLAFTLGVTELFTSGKLLASESFRYFEVYVDVGLLYWLMVIAYTGLQKQLEKILSRPYLRN
ncbi:MAG: amino acid ABC transporter permease [Sporolactobacillus sp.]